MLPPDPETTLRALLAVDPDELAETGQDDEPTSRAGCSGAGLEARPFPS
jgi:hypothetical protein